MPECIDCGEEISKERLKVVPGAKRCVECQESAGDVFRYIGIRTHVASKHLGGCEDDIIRNPKMGKKYHLWKRKQKK